MKKIVLAAFTAAVAASALAVYEPNITSNADNPAIQTIYSIDPAPMVYKDTVYLSIMMHFLTSSMKINKRS